MKRTFFVVGLAAWLASGGPAWASSTAFTDAAGDATACGSPVWYCIAVDPYLPSEPAADLLSTEIGTTGSGDLFVEIEVVDLPAWQTVDDRIEIYFLAVRQSDYTNVSFRAVREEDATVGYLAATQASCCIASMTAVTFDPSANTVRWEVSLTRLNEVLDMTCPSCADFVIGDTLIHLSAYGYFVEVNNYTGLTPINTTRHNDWSHGGSATYTLGA